MPLPDLIDMRSVVFTCCLITLASTVQAQPVAKFLLGAAAGLAMHEAGHVAADVSFGVAPGVKKVSFGGIPFFAITHRALSPAREFVVASAGFWVQEASSEILLTRTANLRGE